MGQTNAAALPKIGEAFEGGTYAGVLTNQAGELYALVLDHPQGSNLTWQQAMAWAKQHGGDLPNRVEAAMLFALLKPRLVEEWHWTNEEHSASYAWGCGFGYGIQNGNHKSTEGSAVAVRRLPLQSFNPFEDQAKRAAEGVAQTRAAAHALLAACDMAERATQELAEAA